MGGTLPLIARQVTAPNRPVGEWVGWLYGINTIGAALGCYLTGFHFLRLFGLAWTSAIAVACSVCAGAAAIALAPRSGAFEPAKVSPLGETIADETSLSAVTYRVWVLYFVAAATGAAALSLQVLWTRQLSLVLGGSIYAFSAMLLVVLVGIGVGSLLYHACLKQLVAARYAPAILLGSLALAAVGGKLMVANLTAFVGANRSLRASHFLDTLLSLSSSAVLELLPALAMGIFFPALVAMSRQTGKHAGTVVGSLYAWNTFGTMLGATATSLILIPWCGVDRSFAIVVGTYFLAALVLLPLRGKRDVAQHVANALAGCLLIWIATQGPDPRYTNAGMYLYGYNKWPERAPLLFFREGAACDVLVTGTIGGAVSLRVNGKIDAGTQGDMRMQSGLAYFPRFVKPEARNVLVIGFGSGTTSGASLLPGDTRVVCCEIEPAVFAASKYFAGVNHSPEKSPNFSIVLDDARTFVQGTDERFDLILSAPSNPWMAGIANLFTQEFYEAVQKRLPPDGVFAQWVQTYKMSPDDYAMVVRTVRSVFPHVVLVRVSSNDTMLLATRDPIAWGPRMTRAAQALVDRRGAMRSDLEKYFRSSDVASLLVRHVMLDQQGIQRLLAKDGQSAINTDRNLQLEFRAPLRLFEREGAGDVDDSIVAAADASWFETLCRRFDVPIEPSALNELALLFARKGRKVVARQLVDFGLGEKPDAELLVTRLTLATTVDQALCNQILEQLGRLPAAETAPVGVAFSAAKRYSEAVDVFRRIAAQYPDSASAWTNLGLNYEALGQRQKALEAWTKAQRLEPMNEPARAAISRLNDSQPATGGAESESSSSGQRKPGGNDAEAGNR